MRPLVITVCSSETGTTTDYSFSASPVRIGRNPLNDLELPFAFVSGWHAVVRFEDDTAKFFDLGSTNGTLLHGRRVEAGEPVLVGEGTALNIGKLELRFRRDHASQSPPHDREPAIGAGGEPMAEHAGGAVAAGVIEANRPDVPCGQGEEEGTAHVQLGDVHHAVQQLRAVYDGYRGAWTSFFRVVETTVLQMNSAARGVAIAVLAREFPALVLEQDFIELATRCGASPPLPGPPQGADAPAAHAQGGVASITQLAERLRPGEEPPRSAEEAQRFLTCIEDVLRASAKAFIELQKGQEQFGSEMGVRTIKEFTALHAAGTADNVLRYLLDWQHGGPHRTKELVGVYADLMIHHVALINGVMEGVRSLLTRLDPQEIEREVTASWPTRAAATWKQYAVRYRQLTEEDKRITQAVFGPEFARAYAEVGGERRG